MLKAKTISAFILIISSFFLFCYQFFLHKTNVLKIYKPIYNNFQILIELKNKDIDSNAFVTLNTKTSAMPKVRNFLVFNTSSKIDNLELLFKKDFNNYKSILIYNGIKPYYFKDFSRFEKENKTLCFDNNCSEFVSYKPFKNIKNINYNSNFNTLNVFLLTLFSGHYWFFSSYLLFVFGLFLLSKTSFKINHKKVLFLIILLIISLRLNGFSDNILLYDDYYTLDIVSPSSSFLNIFKDPGNPCFLYLLYKIYFLIFPYNIYFAKGLALFISLLFLAVSWFIVKKEFNLKIANCFLFLLAINIHFVFRSFELRGYILQALLTVLITYFLFKILKTEKTKHFICYFTFAVIAINLHFFESLFLFSNFVFASVVLFYKKEYKKLFKFTIFHLIPILTFLPYFFSTALNKGLLDESFNSWISKTDFKMIKSSILFLYGGIAPLILYLAYFIKSVLNKENKYKLFMIYSFYVPFFVLILAVLISQYKPILIERYMIFLIPLVLINISLFFDFNKKHVVLFFIWVLLIQNHAQIKNNNRNKGLDLISISAAKQFKEQNKNKNVYVLVRNFTYTKNLTVFKFIDYSKDVNYEIVESNKIKTDEYVSNIIDNDKDAVVFTMFYALKDENLDKFTCYFNFAKDICLWKAQKH